jgi:YesN/AraC family two-component response regulator
MARILIADDSELVRKSLKALFADQADWQVCGEASDGQQAIQLAKQLKPDLLILYIAMPVLDGLHAAGEIVERELHFRSSSTLCTNHRRLNWKRKKWARDVWFPNAPHRSCC